jgi:hypothetical protein
MITATAPTFSSNQHGGITMNTEMIRTLVNAHIQGAYALRDLVESALEQANAGIASINAKYENNWDGITDADRETYESAFVTRNLLQQMDQAIRTAGQGSMQLI